MLQAHRRQRPLPAVPALRPSSSSRRCRSVQAGSSGSTSVPRGTGDGSTLAAAAAAFLDVDISLVQRMTGAPMPAEGSWDEAYGALLGACVGDAAGAVLEFADSNNNPGTVSRSCCMRDTQKWRSGVTTMYNKAECRTGKPLTRRWPASSRSACGQDRMRSEQ